MKKVVLLLSIVLGISLYAHGSGDDFILEKEMNKSIEKKADLEKREIKEIADRNNISISEAKNIYEKLLQENYMKNQKIREELEADNAKN